MKELNNDLIDRVLARIQRDPAAWNQSDFFHARNNDDGNFCGTTACFAGHALLESGWTMQIEEHKWPGFNPVIRIYDLEGRQEHHFETAAANLLGFTEWEADQVFFCTSVDTVEEMREIIENIRDARNEINRDVTPG